jgi:coatomer protein complex subunit epsilon
VISEISDSAPTALQAVKQLALYLSSADKRPGVLAALEALRSDPAVALNASLLLVLASVYAREGQYPEALKACHAGGASLELQALSVQLLLAMERPDAAEKAVKAMVAADDDATLTQLAGAWVNVALGGPKVQEAAYAFQELGDKYSWTVKLHCGAAVCHMAMGQWEEAEKDLLEALGKDGKDAETLANLVAVNLHLGKRSSAKVRTYTTQLRAVAPEHPVLLKTAALETAFDAAAAAAVAA